MSEYCPRCGSGRVSVLFNVEIFTCDSRQYLNSRVVESFACKSNQIERLAAENAKLLESAIECSVCGLTQNEKSAVWCDECVGEARQEIARLQSLLITFGKADLKLEEHDDGVGCDNLIDDHANAYEAIKAEARRLAKEVTE